MTDSELFDEWYSRQSYSQNPTSRFRLVAKRAVLHFMKLARAEENARCVGICEARGKKGGYTAHMTEAKRIAKALRREL